MPSAIVTVSAVFPLQYNFRTRVINRSLNPEFTETFTFPAVTKSALEKKELW